MANGHDDWPTWTCPPYLYRAQPPPALTGDYYELDDERCCYGWLYCPANCNPDVELAWQREPHPRLASIYVMHGAAASGGEQVCGLGWRDCDDPRACARIVHQRLAPIDDNDEGDVAEARAVAGEWVHATRTFIAALPQHNERRRCALGWYGCRDPDACAQRDTRGGPDVRGYAATRVLPQHRRSDHGSNAVVDDSDVDSEHIRSNSGSSSSNSSDSGAD